MNIKYYFSKLMKKIQISAIEKSHLHKTSRVASKSHLVKATLGKYSYIGNDCTVLNTEIGSFCSIADNTIIGGASHPIDWISSSPVFHSGKNILRKNFFEHSFKSSKKTIIGNDVWIGNNCLIKSGVKISNGAIIGMGSVVTKDIGPFEIWAGNPAKLIKKRFDDQTIENILESRWWTWDDSKLLKHAPSFNQPKSFIETLRKD